LFTASRGSVDVVISDEVGEYIPHGETVKGWSGRFFLPTLAEHFRRQEVDLRRGTRGGLSVCAALGAAAAETAFLAVQGADTLVDGVREARGDEGEDNEVLEPEGHE
jgi:hypothetical protein